MRIIPGARLFSVSRCTVNLARTAQTTLSLMVTLVRGGALTIETVSGIECLVDIPDDQPAHATSFEVDADLTKKTTVTTHPDASKSLVFIVRLEDKRGEEDTDPRDPFWIKLHTTAGEQDGRVTYGISRTSPTSIEYECLHTIGVPNTN